ncbi:hypothetical protein AUC43_11255 [Hymenobacter sedentarius]|uniref:DUF4397 domain-containing protein n=1 Tax=Hymenobacter sedentarius TaxID=1411621 RepID=A0A0U3SYJ6_9BACT|nr:hypothetical protein [Hymenobacter sedentarius]ALW85619.1 hypothetical protein AUC43_11255 [Hymenobacter sedentarius]
MKSYIPARTTLCGLLALAVLATGCKKELDDFYTPAGDTGFASITLPNLAVNTKYAVGETIPISLGYNAADQLKSVSVFQVINKTDSVTTGTYNAGGTLNTALGLTVQTVPYVVPNVANGLPVRVDVISTFANGATRLRRFTYNVANNPTLKFGATPATYRNGLAAAAQSENDLIGYSLIINENGVSTFPPPTATPTAQLFKAVDSLTYFSRIGTGPLVRQGVVKNPTAGVTNTRTVDVKVPAGSNGQAVTFAFTAYAQAGSTTLVSAPVNVGTPTALATSRLGRVSFGAGSTPDSLAFNLKTGLNEPSASPVAGKDLQVSGLSATGSLTLNAPNTTRYYKLTAAQLTANPYATATANAIGNLVFQNTLVADLGTATAGDVYAVKVRGTSEVMLLRIQAVRPSTSGGIGRVKFEYRSL